jgi:hypothetical protein
MLVIKAVTTAKCPSVSAKCQVPTGLYYSTNSTSYTYPL